MKILIFHPRLARHLPSLSQASCRPPRGVKDTNGSEGAESVPAAMLDHDQRLQAPLEALGGPDDGRPTLARQVCRTEDGKRLIWSSAARGEDMGSLFISHSSEDSVA